MKLSNPKPGSPAPAPVPMPASRPRRRPSVVWQFVDGVLALPRGVRFVLGTRAAWPLAAMPVVLCTLLCSAAVAASARFVPQLMATWWPGLSSTLGGFGSGVLRVLAIVLSSLVGMFVATLATPPLCAPALERLVRLRERALDAPPRPAVGFWRELACALQAQLISVGVLGPLLLVLLLVTWLVPPVAVVTLPIKFGVVAGMLAWSYLDYPLSLRGASVSERVRTLAQGFARVLGFGLTLAVAFMVPLVSLLLLPAAVAAAAEIAVKLELERGSGGGS